MGRCTRNFAQRYETQHVIVVATAALAIVAAAVLLNVHSTETAAKLRILREYEHTENDGVGYEDVVYNDSHYRNFAPIHEAAKRGDVAAIQFELDEGVPVDLRVRNKGGNGSWGDTTPLMWAAARGQADALKFLIQHGADVNAQTGEASPLIAAAAGIATLYSDHAECVRALLAAGARFEVWAIEYACGGFQPFDWLDDVPDESLLPEKRLPNPFRNLRPIPGNFMGGQAAVSWRVEQALAGDSIRLRLLLKAAGERVNDSAFASGLLQHAATSSDLKRLRILIEQGLHHSLIGTEEWDLILKAAATYGSGEMFQLLCQLGKPSHVGQLLRRAVRGEEDTAHKVRLILSSGTFETEILSDALRSVFTWKTDPTDAGSVLLEAGADINTRDDEGNGLLLLAAGSGRAAMLKRLMAAGPDVRVRAAKPPHDNALIKAAASSLDSAAKVQTLLEAGIPVDEQNDEGRTALLAAAMAGNSDAVIILVRKGANVHTRASQVLSQDWARGLTVLEYVANRGSDVYMCEATGGSAIRVLLNHGAGDDFDNVKAARRRAESIENTDAIKALDEFLDTRMTTNKP
jgi:ankyrin repeat protein